MQKKGNTTGERNRGTQGTQCAGEGKHRETQRNATGPMYRRGTLASNDHKLGRRRIEGKIAFLNPFNIFTHEFCSVQTLIIEDKQFYSILLFSKAHLISPPVRSLSPWGGSTIHGEGVGISICPNSQYCGCDNSPQLVSTLWDIATVCTL